MSEGRRHERRCCRQCRSWSWSTGRGSWSRSGGGRKALRNCIHSVSGSRAVGACVSIHLRARDLEISGNADKNSDVVGRSVCRVAVSVSVSVSVSASVSVSEIALHGRVSGPTGRWHWARRIRLGWRHRQGLLGVIICRSDRVWSLVRILLSTTLSCVNDYCANW